MKKSAFQNVSLVVTILSALLLSACQPRVRAKTEEKSTVLQELTKPATQEKDIEGKSYFKNFISPLMKTLTTDYPELAANFYHIILQRDWFITTTELDSITKKLIGTYVKSELALQDLKRIWLDKKKFEALSEREQATVMLHQLVLGVKLMGFASKQDQCIAKTASVHLQTPPAKSADDLKAECVKNNPNDPKAKPAAFKLSDEDFETIREVVSLLDRTNPEIEQVKQLLKPKVEAVIEEAKK